MKFPAIPSPSSLVWKLFLGAFVVGAIFSFGAYVGGTMSAGKWKARAYETAANGSKIIAAKQGEADQCRAQIDKINVAIMEQEAAQSARAAKDRAERAAAEREARIRDQQKLEKESRVLAALEEIKDGIESGQFDACVSTVADREFIGLLNSALENGDSD